MTHSTTPPKQSSATNRTLVDGVAFIRIDDTNAPNARVAIHVEHPSHDQGVRCFFRRADGDVAASIRSHLRTSLPDDLTRVEITDTVGLGISEADVLPRRMARETPFSPSTEVTVSSPRLVTDGGTDFADRAERIERVDELRPQLAEQHDFATDSDPECAECGTHDDVYLDPGLSLEDLQYRCEEHKRLRVKFWLFPGPHPSMPSPENLFTCDACDDEFVFPYGLYAVERWGDGRHEYHEYRCLECATLQWLRRFCTEHNQMEGFEAMFAESDERSGE